MKLLFYSLLTIILLAIILLGGCTKKENYSTPITYYPETGKLEAYIDGEHVTWTASCTVDKRPFGNYMSIMAQQDGPTRGILLFFEHVQLSPSEYLLPDKGEYTTDTSDAYYILYDIHGIPEQYSSTGGKLAITSVSDSIVQGTFWFTTKYPKAKKVYGTFSTRLRINEQQ